MKNILVTGANGQVGRALLTLSESHKENFIFTDKSNLDITKSADLIHFFEKQDLDFVINCAAYTQVDKAENEIDLATDINADAVLYLALECSKYDIPFIHISSDYVYHPDHSNIMAEDEPTSPKGIYASTKLQGDLYALQNHAKSIILRTSWVYTYEGKNFVNTIARLAKERSELKVVNDQIGSPTFAPDLAAAILEIISFLDKSENQEKYAGIYHFSNDGFISWFDFAKEIVRISKANCSINACSSSDFPTPARRPTNSRLSKNKIQQTFGISISPWEKSLQKCLL